MNNYKAKNHSPAPSQASKGFSAIELLVTLFIAVLFLSTGYALYGTIVAISSQNRHQAQADNIAFEYLRKYEGNVTSPCVAATPVNAVAVTGASAADLAAPIVTVSVTCPNSAVTFLSLVKVTVIYKEGGTQRNVYHEVFATAR